MADYKQMAIAAARRHNIPPELFLRLVQQESGFRPDAVSSAGAIGLGQLMPGTARELGVDPRDPAQNLEGAARYLAAQYRDFGDWNTALAAYNAGPGAVRKHGGIPPYSETQNYVKTVGGADLSFGPDVPAMENPTVGGAQPMTFGNVATQPGIYPQMNALQQYGQDTNERPSSEDETGMVSVDVGNMLRPMYAQRQNALAQMHQQQDGPQQNALGMLQGPANGDPRRGMFPTGATVEATGEFANMSPEAMTAWNRLTSKYPDLKVRSAYRDPEHNKRVGGARRSQHMHGNAFDIPVDHLSHDERTNLIQDAYASGFRGVGVYNGALHFDVGPQRAWGPDYTSKSIPGWARPIIR